VATTREWSDAYLAQARADLEAAGQLGGAVPSVFAMLLQMALEKIAKAWLLRTGQIDLAGATSSHSAASRMVALLKRDRRRLATLGYGDAYAWKDVLPLVQELERAHPQFAEGGPAARVLLGATRREHRVARPRPLACSSPRRPALDRGGPAPAFRPAALRAVRVDRA